MEMWLADKCPLCKEKNFWCNGDPEDSSTSDTNNYQCWSCRSIIDLYDDDSMDYDPHVREDQEDDGVDANGIKSPT